MEKSKERPTDVAAFIEKHVRDLTDITKVDTFALVLVKSLPHIVGLIDDDCIPQLDDPIKRIELIFELFHRFGFSREEADGAFLRLTSMTIHDSTMRAQQEVDAASNKHAAANAHDLRSMLAEMGIDSEIISVDDMLPKDTVKQTTQAEAVAAVCELLKKHVTTGMTLSHFAAHFSTVMQSPSINMGVIEDREGFILRVFYLFGFTEADLEAHFNDKGTSLKQAFIDTDIETSSQPGPPN